MRSHDPSYAERACATATEVTKQPTAAAQARSFLIVFLQSCRHCISTNSQLAVLSAESARHGASFHRAVGAVRVDVERTRGSLDHLARDDDFLDAFQAREVEHGLEQNALQDRTQASRAGLALDRLAGDRA